MRLVLASLMVEKKLFAIDRRKYYDKSSITLSLVKRQKKRFRTYKIIVYLKYERYVYPRQFIGGFH